MPYLFLFLADATSNDGLSMVLGYSGIALLGLGFLASFVTIPISLVILARSSSSDAPQNASKDGKLRIGTIISVVISVVLVVSMIVKFG